MSAPGKIHLLLHAHLPFVREPDYDRFLEENWFFEAMSETYLPLVQMLWRLQERGVPGTLNLSVSSSLLAMFTDRVLLDKFTRHLHMQMDLLEKEKVRLQDNHEFLTVVDSYYRRQLALIDDWENRFDRVLPVEAGNAAFVLTFLRRGVPLLFNGNEIADNSLNTFFAAAEDVGRARKTVDWARALQPAGQKRMSLIRELSRLHHENPVFADGAQEWVTAGEALGTVAFVRRLGDRAVFVAANLTAASAEFPSGVKPIPGMSPLLADSGELTADGLCRLGPWGFVVAETICA